jgi:hypothetical protein
MSKFIYKGVAVQEADVKNALELLDADKVTSASSILTLTGRTDITRRLSNFYGQNDSWNEFKRL